MNCPPATLGVLMATARPHTIINNIGPRPNGSLFPYRKLFKKDSGPPRSGGVNAFDFPFNGRGTSPALRAVFATREL